MCHAANSYDKRAIMLLRIRSLQLGGRSGTDVEVAAAGFWLLAAAAILVAQQSGAAYELSSWSWLLVIITTPAAGTTLDDVANY